MLELLKEGLLVTVFSMFIVFTVLEVISLLISLQSFILNKSEKEKKKELVTVNSIAIVEKEDDLEIIAAITAALTMYTGLKNNQFKIKSIVRTKDNLNWRKA